MIYSVTGAMPEEISRLCDEFGAVMSDPEFDVYAGSSGGDTVLVCKSGIGKVNAAIAAQRLIDKYRPDAMIAVGIAGAVGAGTETMDVVLSDELFYHDFDPAEILETDTKPYTSRFPADRRLLAAAEAVCGECVCSGAIRRFIRGNVASGDRFVSDKATAGRVRDGLGAVCVEMEGAAFAQTCLINKVPFLVVRCISDFAGISTEEEYYALKRSAADTAALITSKLVRSLSSGA